MISFLELCKNSDLAAEVSLQPYRVLGVDAVIFFSDILIPVEAMGLDVALTDKGPELANPIRQRSDVDRLRIPDPATEVPFVGSIIKNLRQQLQNEVPLIGFAGAPWTLASYMIEGGGSKSFAEIKTLAYREPRVLHALLDKLASTVSSYLLFQIESGAQVVQLFDTWAGELNRSDYEEFALPYTQKIFEAIGDRVQQFLEEGNVQGDRTFVWASDARPSHIAPCWDKEDRDAFVTPACLGGILHRPTAFGREHSP